jgi:uncharacterized iron-regulated protein
MTTPAWTAAQGAAKPLLLVARLPLARLQSAVLATSLAFWAAGGRPAWAQAPAPTAEACAGEIVDAAAGTPLTFDAMLARASAAKVTIVGERHGVEAHPKAAACLLGALARAWPQADAPSAAVVGALVLEQVERRRQAAIEAFRAEFPETVDGLGARLEWWRTGWPAWRIYQPLLAAAWRARVDVLAADVSSQDVSSQDVSSQDVSSQDVSSQDGAHLGERLAELGARGDQIVATWAEATKIAQCGLLSEEEARKAGRDQALRDLGFVELLERRDGPALFYAGRAHARRDRAVPALLEAAGRSTFVVALQETHAEGVAIDRARALADARGRFDAVWFVGASREGDACDRLRRKGLIP